MFIVLMRRNGDYDAHCYVLGAWQFKDVAIKEGIKEHRERGHKYEAELQVTDHRGYVVERLDQDGEPLKKV